MKKVAFEGLPRAGKTTQINACKKRLAELGYTSKVVGKPPSIGYYIVTYLLNHRIMPLFLQRLLLKKKHGIFLKWRIESLKTENSCDFILYDRLILSTLIFGKTFCITDKSREVQLLQRASDTAIVLLCVPPHIIKERIMDSGKKLPSLIIKYLEELDNTFLDVVREFDMSIVVDGTKDRASITDEIIAFILNKSNIHAEKSIY